MTALLCSSLLSHQNSTSSVKPKVGDCRTAATSLLTSFMCSSKSQDGEAERAVISFMCFKPQKPLLLTSQPEKAM